MRKMKNRIEKICRNLERKENIRILFAVENGSRAWRMASKDSDYDVRFVFVRPIREYVKIGRPSEVMNIAFDSEGNKCKAEGSLIDISGFDIFKFVTLLSNSNPTTIEWLVTDIIYYGKQNDALRKFALENFSPASLYYHYRSLAENNYNKYIKKGKRITHKRYLQIFRGLLNAKWVANKRTVPPISLVETLDEMKKIMPDYIVKTLQEIIEIKSRGKEKEKIQRITELDGYIESFLEDCSKSPTGKSQASIDLLNTELRKIVLNGGD